MTTRNTQPITSFRGEYAEFSNFFPVIVTYESIAYDSLENAYQAAKVLDPEIRKAFAHVSPRQAKNMGRALQDIRPDWDDIKFRTMKELLVLKFSQPRFRSKLLQTGKVQLIEGNTWGDRIWGAEQINGVWVGSNWLGKLLMEVRDELRRSMGWL